MIIHRRRGAELASAADLLPGETLGGYRVERLLGTGGMGAVYEATQLSLKRRVALKVIAAGVPIDDVLRGRFRREGELQAVIDHPHILPVYEAGEDRGRLYIAMRMVAGPTLKARVAKRSLDPPTALRILSDVAAALDSAHGAGLVHRDVKPQNILIGPGDYPYLADFGLSRSRGDDTLTRSGQMLGSLSYMAPEQIRGERVGPAADIYSFTCVLYECLLGLVPFPRETDAAVLHAHEWDEPPRASEIRPELPSALDAVIAVGMAKDPSARPNSACAVVAAACAAFGIEHDNDAHPTVPFVDDPDAGDDTFMRVPPPPPRDTRWGALKRPLGVAAAAGTLLLGGAVGYVAARDPGEPAPQTQTVTASGADSTYAQRLTSAFTDLRGAAAPLQRDLKRAKSPHKQSLLLRRLARRYGEARTAVSRAHPAPSARSANAAVERALARLAARYQALATLARRHDRHAYNRSRTLLARERSQLSRATQSLEEAGYRLQ